MNNNASDDNLEKALDDIFGNDFLEIDLGENNEPTNNIDDLLESKDEEDKEVDVIANKDDFILDSNETNNVANNLEPKKKKSSKNIFVYLFIILIIVVAAILIIYLPNYFNNKEYVTNCSYKVSDKGYVITDEYKITYMKGKIKYLDGMYKYTALNDEYKAQIEFVSKEKLPIIINSNGMPGFTYVYELSDDYFSVNSYLDFTMFDYNIIDKNNNDTNPISYIPINSKTTYKSLINNFKKNGYICTKSK